MSNPNIKVIPPLVYAGFFLLGWGMEQVAPAVEDMGSYWPQVKDRIGYLLMALSAILVIPSMLAFRRVDTPFDVRKAASSLVTSGPYRVTRNPGYMALTALHMGLAIKFSLNWPLAMVVLAILVMDRYVIPREEAHLEEIFGDEYRAYKAKVRRWF
ncbi:MAG: isoprenylcysteine carboxylmethyltransferase family protein [Proteobacteria bacterium]|nr:isoprenylcysteine carboxylmethyltransferase family protein [Pseudomonadota bacterium]